MKYQEFLERANKVHGDKYEYPYFEENSGKGYIEIICSKHGVFKQNIYAHLKGQGCPKCLGRRNYTTEDFIREAKEKFGDKFDYSKVKYRGKRTKVLIMCKDLISKDNPNGEFWQSPLRHIDSPTGMPFVGKRNREYPKLTDPEVIKNKTEEFKEKVSKIFNDKYDTSKVIYTGSLQKVTLICPEHGEFASMACTVLAGHGCPSCVKNKKLTINEFITKANNIHKSKYDYSLVNFENSNNDVEIICPEHGIFKQNVTHHLMGHGCPKCANNKPLSTEEFIEKAKKIHGDKYDYTKVVYNRSNRKVCIICSKHGEFWQTPNSHLNGQGCPECCESHLEEEIRQLLTENNINYIREYNLSDIKNKHSMPFDFFLPDYNIMIECQGSQHFKQSELFKETIEERIKKDKIKYEGCINKKIKILYYTDRKNYNLMKRNGFQFYQNIYSDENLFINKVEILNELIK